MSYCRSALANILGAARRRDFVVLPCICPADKYAGVISRGAHRCSAGFQLGLLSSSVNYLAAPRQICKQIADDGPKGFLCILLTVNLYKYTNAEWRWRSILIINTLQFAKATVASPTYSCLSVAFWNQQINLWQTWQHKGFAHLRNSISIFAG